MITRILTATLAASLLLMTFPGVVLALSIPQDKLDEQKVFWGNAAKFEKPGEVNYAKIVKATAEYQAIKKKKIKPGTAKYWIQMSAASKTGTMMATSLFIVLISFRGV